MLGLCWVWLWLPRCSPLTTLHIRTCGPGHYSDITYTAPLPDGRVAPRHLHLHQHLAPCCRVQPLSYLLQTLPDTIGPAARPALKHHEYGQCTNSVVKRSLFMYLFRYWIELNLIISILNQWRGKIFYCFVEILACFWTILERVFIFLCSVKKKVNRFISKTCFPLKCTRCSKFQSV